MKLEQQVTSLEISKRLKELGVKQESLFAWFSLYKKEGHELGYISEIVKYPVDRPSYISAFTVAELGEMLPKSILWKEWKEHMDEKLELRFAINTDSTNNCIVSYVSNKDKKANYYQWADTEADARGKMLIYLLENKLINL